MYSFYLLAFYVFVLHLAPLLRVFGSAPGGRTSYIVDTATLIPIALSALLFVRGGRRGAQRLTHLDAAFLLYLVLSVVSVAAYFLPGNPSSVVAYLYGLHLFVLPMSCYFAVKMLDSQMQRRFVTFLCVLNIAAMLFGFYVQFTRPPFYTKYLMDSVFEQASSVEDWHAYSRMQSYLGSTAVGTISAVSIVLSAMSSLGHRLVIVSMPVMLLAAALANQRGGIAASALASIYVLLLGRRLLWQRIIATIAALVLAYQGLVFFGERYEGVVEGVVERSTVGMTETLGGRGYRPGLNYFYEFPLGVGLGGASSAAESVGLARMGQVVDANFMRVLAELGLLGLVALLLVLGAAARSAWRQRDRWGWLTVLAIFCAISLGTNTLDSHYVSHLFWLVLGMLDSGPALAGARQRAQAGPLAVGPGDPARATLQARLRVAGDIALGALPAANPVGSPFKVSGPCNRKGFSRVRGSETPL